MVRKGFFGDTRQKSGLYACQTGTTWAMLSALFILVLFFLLVVLEFKFRASCLLGRHSTSLERPGLMFIPKRDWIVILRFTLLYCWDDRCTHHAQLIGWDKVSKTISWAGLEPWFSQTASQVAVITGVRHWTKQRDSFF
jgi:hypothetical protein